MSALNTPPHTHTHSHEHTLWSMQTIIPVVKILNLGPDFWTRWPVVAAAAPLTRQQESASRPEDGVCVTASVTKVFFFPLSLWRKWSLSQMKKLQQPHWDEELLGIVFYTDQKLWKRADLQEVYINTCQYILTYTQHNKHGRTVCDYEQHRMKLWPLNDTPSPWHHRVDKSRYWNRFRIFHQK